MPFIDLSILNQRQTPAFYADVFANRPAAGFVGRIFVSTDTYAFYRDNGTGWDLIGGPGTGTVTGTGANGQVTFWNGASTITGSNDLFWDATNGHLGVNTNTPGTAADIHHDQSTILQLNQTTVTNDTRIAFQNGGSSKWRVGNFYSAGSNDYKVNDAVLNINRFTIKSSSGQTFVGDETTSSGLFVVNNSSGDAHIVALGATAPSIRVRNAGVGATLQFGLGLATTTNNFIQGATGGEFCIFNDSLTAQPILFGIKDAGLGNTQEAARISASRNFLVGTSVDAGQKLQISGTAYISGNTSIGTTINTYILQTSADGTAGQVQFDQYGNVGSNILLRSAKGTSAAPTATQSGDLLGSIGSRGYDGTNFSGGGRTGMYMYAAENFTATNQGSFLLFGTTPAGTASRVERLRITDIGNVGIGTATPGYQATNRKVLAINGGNAAAEGSILAFMQNGVNKGYVFSIQNDMELWCESGEMRIGNASANNIEFRTNNIVRQLITGSTGNILIGTTTDAGYKLAVNGSTIIGNPATNSNYGGFAFFTLRILAGITTNFFQVPGSNNWAGITEISWVSSADANRSGAALLRWAYDSGTANTGVVYTAYSNNQNAVPTFTFGGGYLRIDIAGGSADYYVQFRIQGSQSV